jgi:hypothetical protein
MARTEWAARSHSFSLNGERKREVIPLTHGNGSKDVITIVSDGVGLRLEDLAAGREVHNSFTRAITTHLLTISWIKNHTWFLFAVGTI